MDTNKIKEDIIQLSITQSKLENKIEKIKALEFKLENIIKEKEGLEHEYKNYLVNKNIEIINKYRLYNDTIFMVNIYKEGSKWYLYLKGSTDFTNDNEAQFIVLEDDTLELYCYWENGNVIAWGNRYKEEIIKDNLSLLKDYGFEGNNFSFYFLNGNKKGEWYLHIFTIDGYSNFAEFKVLDDDSLELCTYTKDKKIIVKNGEKYEE